MRSNTAFLSSLKKALRIQPLTHKLLLAESFSGPFPLARRSASAFYPTPTPRSRQWTRSSCARRGRRRCGPSGGRGSGRLDSTRRNLTRNPKKEKNPFPCSPNCLIGGLQIARARLALRPKAVERDRQRECFASFVSSFSLLVGEEEEGREERSERGKSRPVY